MNCKCPCNIAPTSGEGDGRMPGHEFRTRFMKSNAEYWEARARKAERERDEAVREAEELGEALDNVKPVDPPTPPRPEGAEAIEALLDICDDMNRHRKADFLAERGVRAPEDGAS